MLPRPRPALVTAIFVLVFAILANLAWATAIRTTAPWYDATVSLAVYSLTIVVATFLAAFLTVNASRAATGLASSLRRVDRRIALLRVQVKPRAVRAPPKGSLAAGDDGDLDAMLDSLGDGPMTSLVRVEKEGHDTLVPLPVSASPARTAATEELLRELVSERVAIRGAQARVWSLAAGPMAACLAFLAVAGPMLPGSGAFAATHFQLNTTLILFLAYGLAPLVAWAVLTLAWVWTPSPRPAK